MWDAISNVNSGVTLIAFLVAAAAWLYRGKLLADAELIRTAPEEERAKLVLANYGFFEVDTAKLKRDQ